MILAVTLIIGVLAATTLFGTEGVIWSQQNEDDAYCAAYQASRHPSQTPTEQESAETQNSAQQQQEAIQIGVYYADPRTTACVGNAIARANLHIYGQMLIGGILTAIFSALSVMVAAIAADGAAAAAVAATSALTQGAEAGRARMVPDLVVRRSPWRRSSFNIRNIGVGPGLVTHAEAWTVHPGAIDPLIRRGEIRRIAIQASLAAGETCQPPVARDKGLRAERVVAVRYLDAFGVARVNWMRLGHGGSRRGIVVIDRGEYEEQDWERHLATS